MLIVIIVYLIIKNVLSIRREDPLRRGTYENIYFQFSLEHPHLWSRATGPRKSIRPSGPFSYLKWRLVTYWFAPSRTIINRPLADIDDMGLWARIKHKLARRWLNDIDVYADSDDGSSAAELGEASSGGDFGAVTELVALGTGVGMADADPHGAMRMGGSSAVRRAMMAAAAARRSRSRSSSGSGAGRLGRGRGRAASGGAARATSSTGSGAMVCEEGTTMTATTTATEEESEERERAVLEQMEREERRREREESPTGAGAMGMLSVPTRGGEYAPW
jgi:hypothetical protein